MKILVIEARFYDKISDALLEGALDVLQKAKVEITKVTVPGALCLLYTSPSPRDKRQSRMPSSA